MSEAEKMADYLGFEVVYLDGFAYIQEEGTNGPEIKRDATLEERTLWTELEHVSAELAALKAAMGEPKGWIRKWAHDGEKPKKEKNSSGRLAWPWKFKLMSVTAKQCLPDDVPLYAIPKDKP